MKNEHLKLYTVELHSDSSTDHHMATLYVLATTETEASDKALKTWEDEWKYSSGYVAEVKLIATANQYGKPKVLIP